MNLNFKLFGHQIGITPLPVERYRVMVELPNKMVPITVRFFKSRTEALEFASHAEAAEFQHFDTDQIISTLHDVWNGEDLFIFNSFYVPETVQAHVRVDVVKL